MILKKRSTFFEIFKKYIFIFSFLAISLFHFAVFWVYINADTIRMTFFRFNNVTQEYVWCGLYNYKEVISHIFVPSKANIEDINAFKNTFYSIFINLTIFPIALIISYAFYKRIPGTKTFRVIFYLPSIISIVILCMAYKAMFRAETGPIWQLFAAFGYEHEWLVGAPSNPTVWPCIFIFCVINGFGTNVILMASAMQRIPNEISESSRLDGCGFFRELFFITIPCIMPTITSWMTMIFTSVFGFFVQPMLLAPSVSEGFTTTIPMAIFSIAESGKTNLFIGAATLGIFLSLFMLPWVLLMRFIMNKVTPEVSY